MQTINVTIDDQGKISVGSPFDPATTILALLEAQKAVLMQTFTQPQQQPAVEAEVITGE